NLESQENLFGQSEFTSKWDENFDQIIEQLVNKHERNFGIKEINEEISSKIESGCQINPPNIVILEPGPAPDSNASVFKSIDITEDRNIKQYTEAFWKLVDELTSAFNHPDPTQHDLFRHAQEMKPDGYTRMFNFYKKGLIRLYNILHEDIYKTKE
ncbi:1702_t:CDS:2, partial [Dentiscutata heterogama]